MERKLNIILISSITILLFVILNYIVSLNGLDIISYSESDAYVPRGKRNTLQIKSPILNAPFAVGDVSFSPSSPTIGDGICLERASRRAQGCGNFDDCNSFASCCPDGGKTCRNAFDNCERSRARSSADRSLLGNRQVCCEETSPDGHSVTVKAVSCPK